MTRPTQDQIDIATTAWAASAERICSDLLPTLRGLAQRAANEADGYPRSSFSEHRGGGELTPVEAAAAARERATDLERMAIRRYVAIERAFVEMNNVLARIIANDQSGESYITEQANEAGGFCVNCARHSVQSVRRPGGSALCNPCFVYRGRNDMSDRPAELVLRHERRRRPVCGHRASTTGRGIRV